MAGRENPVMKFTDGSCPNCGKSLFNYNPREWRYGSPIRTCRRCKQKYADSRYHEIAVDGISEDSMSIKSRIIIIVLGALITYRGIYLLDYRMSYVYSHNWTAYVFIILGIIMFVGGIADIVTIKSGFKQKKLDRLECESVKRLSNYEYAKQLKDLGYDVPAYYLE